MKNYPVYCAIDIDDQHFNIAVLPPDQEHRLLLKSAPTVSALIKKITSKAKGLSISDIRLCYEATYLGFDLYRKLKSKGIHCDVIAPSSIPLPPGKRVKTDRIDSTKLLEYYQKGMVSFVYVPSEDDEMIRNLPRSRALLVKDLSKIKAHMIFLCRRMGLDYRKATHKPNANYWTKIHQKWLETQINQLPDHSLLRFNLSTLLGTYRNLEIQVDAYNNKIQEVAKLSPYKKKVEALEAFRGLDTLSALTLVTELGDIKRFPHPANAASYAGLSIAEYFSGGKEKRFSITKQGNRFIRTTVVEACQYAFMPPKVSRQLAERRKGVLPESINIADRCMHRLYKKAGRLIYRGKPKNKIKVACAREMLCFIWEALQYVA